MRKQEQHGLKKFVAKEEQQTLPETFEEFHCKGIYMKLKSQLYHPIDVLQTTPTKKLVLLTLLSMANDEHQCWPSLNTLVFRTCLTKQGVINGLKELEEEGILVVQKRLAENGACVANLYTISLEGLDKANQGNTKYRGSQPDRPPQSTQLTTLVNPVDPNIHKNIKEKKQETNISFEEYKTLCQQKHEVWLPMDLPVIKEYFDHGWLDETLYYGLRFHYNAFFTDSNLKYKGERGWRQAIGKAVRQDWGKFFYADKAGNQCITSAGQRSVSIVLRKLSGVSNG